MEKAKTMVHDFMSKAGKHTTTVHESIDPALVNEQVKPSHHEHTTVALDKEVHQDHYHTSIQPVTFKETLPDIHTHRVAPIEHREVHHSNEKNMPALDQQEATGTFNKHDTPMKKEANSGSPTTVGEHVHHHIHETIQPVIHKEMIQPHVIHTVVPIHETHYNPAKHHATSVLPSVSMENFKKQGGKLDGREERTDDFQGEPRPIGNLLSG